MIFKTLPSIISSINQLGEASNKLKAINFSMVGLNAGNLDAYRNAISGISKEQAALLLSTQGINQAQVDLVLSNEQVTASEIAEAATLDGVVKKKSILTVEQQKQLISSQALTTEKLAEISATLGLETAENGSLISKKALNAEMVKQQLESIGVIGSTQTQIMNMLGLITAETSAATASNVLSGAMAKLSLAMSTNPIGALVAVIGIAIASVYGLTKAFDALTDSAEEIDERVDDLISKYNDLKTTADNNASTVESLADEYESLSKGVNDLGENISLTSEEYARYNEIVNQIADMFPTLITGYTDEGTAILSLKGNVEQLRDAYKEAQQEAYNMLIISGKDSDGNDIIKNWENLHGTDFFSKLFDLGADDVGGNISTQEAIKQLEALSNMSAEAYRNIEKITSSGTREEIASLTDIEKEIGYGSFLYKALGIDEDVTDEAFAEARKQAQALLQTYQAEIDSGLNNVQTLANAYLMTNEDYDKLDEQSKTAASLLVNSIDEEIANEFSSKSDVGAYVVSIVNSIKDNQEVQDALINLLSLDTSKMSIEEAQNEINKYITIIANYLDENPVDLKLRLGVDIQQDKKELRDRLSHGGQDLVVDDWIDTLTIDEAKLANSTAFDEALERQKKGLDGAALSAENYDAALDEVKASQDGIANETGISMLNV